MAVFILAHKGCKNARNEKAVNGKPGRITAGGEDAENGLCAGTGWGWRLPCGSYPLFAGVVRKIALDMNDRGAAVAAAAHQVAKAANQIGIAAGGGALGGHVAH